MNIGQAANQAGVAAKRIRYYEQIGLIDVAARSDSGYRLYNKQDLHSLRFIRRSRQLGFSIPKIATLLELWRDRGRSNAQVRQVALDHIQELSSKITELQSMVDTLEHLASHCDASSRPDCPILHDLQGRAS